MALTGLVLLGFVIGHMLGNLQVYLGADALDGYAHKLRTLGPLLWGVRGVLLLALLLHGWMVVDLYARSATARPISYRVYNTVATNYAAKAMWLSGVVIFTVCRLSPCAFYLSGPVYEFQLCSRCPR